jgi:hypothetical protein
MSAGPTVSRCRNCGAPLELDDAGRCRWCSAQVRYESLGSQAGLLPRDIDDCATSAPFLYLILSAFFLLGTQDAVQQFLARNPGPRQQMRALAVAVSAAGVRVRDAGLLKDDFDDNLKVYTPNEIWTFTLAVDVIARLGGLEGLPPPTRAQIASDLRSLSDSVRSHHWKTELKRAGDGVPQFRELRAAVPPHN